MATGKKSFVLYADWLESFNDLTDEEAGKLIKHILSYVNDEEPVLEDRVLRAYWLPIKRQLKSDLKKWEKIREKRSEAGKRSAEIKRINKEEQNQQVSTSVKSVEQNQQASTKSTVNVNDNVNVNVNVNDNVNDILLEKETKRFSFKKELLKEGFHEELVDDWLEVRKGKKARNTKTAFFGFMKQINIAESSGKTKNEILNIVVENSWSGFKATWLNNTQAYGTTKSNSTSDSINLGTERQDYRTEN